MSGYDNATHTPDKSRADSMTNTTSHTPGCSNGTTSGRIGIVEAERLYKSNRLRELIGVGAEAQPLDVKAACKRALLLHHPDKGGCAEVFKLVQPATETLLLEENLCAFEGGVPSWAKLQLKDLADLRRDIVIWRTRLESARSKLEAKSTRVGRAKGSKRLPGGGEGCAESERDPPTGSGAVQELLLGACTSDESTRSGVRG